MSQGYVTRTWKRDGTRNTMPLEAAAQNLAVRCSDEAVRDEGAVSIAERLKSGQRLETPHAVFSMNGHDPFTAASGGE